MRCISFFIIISSILITKLSYAQSVGALYHFAEENREVVTHLPEVAPLAKPNFHLTPQEADLILSITSLDREIESYAYADILDENCHDDGSEKRLRTELQETVADRSLRFYFSLTYSGAETYDRLDHLIERDTYASFITQELVGGNYRVPPGNYHFLASQYERVTGQSLAGLSPLERARALENYIKSRYDLDVPTDFLIEEALSQAMIENPSNWREATQGLQNELNFEQKMRIAARMGNTFLGNYNYDRLNDGPDGEIVSMEQLLAAAKNNTQGGVCRDVSFAQSQLLQELGVPKDKIYILAYASPEAFHSVLTVQDPDNPDNLIKLNYGDITQDDRNIGPEALRQYTSLPDIGITYRIFDADAKPIGRIPTELGSVLRDVTNARPSLIKTEPYSLTRVGASDGQHHFNVFTGTTSSGDHIVGAAFDTTIQHTDHISTEVGLGVLRHEHNSPVVEINQNLLYARIGTEFNTGDVHFGDLSVRGEAGGEAEIVYGHHDGQRISDGYIYQGKTFDISNQLFVGVSSVYETGNGSLGATARSYHNVDFANETVATDRTVGFDRAEVSINYENELSPEVRALAEAGVVIRQYGQAAYMRGALEGRADGYNYSTYAGYSTPLSDDTPSFMPEREQILNFGTGLQFDSGWDFDLGYEYSIGRDNHRGSFFLGRQL